MAKLRKFKKTLFFLFLWQFQLNPSTSFAGEMSTPDSQAIDVLKSIFSDNSNEIDLEKEYYATWLKVSDSEPPYLFVTRLKECGASDCLITGYRQVGDTWTKIYEQFGGDGIEMLNTQTEGHHDLRQYESLGAGAEIQKTSKWAGELYGKPILKKI